MDEKLKYPKRRKSPIRHTVKSHSRKGKFVRGFNRGSRTQVVVKKKVKYQPKKFAKYGIKVEGWRARYTDEAVKERLFPIGDFKTWYVGDKLAGGLSYDPKTKRLLVMDLSSYHEVMERSVGYTGTAFNKAKLTRFTMFPKRDEFRIYTYGHGKGSTGGIDGFPRQSGEVLELLLKMNVIKPDYNIRIYFKSGKPHIDGTTYKTKKAILILKTLGRVK